MFKYNFIPIDRASWRGRILSLRAAQKSQNNFPNLLIHLFDPI